MQFELTNHQREHQAAFRHFVQAEVIPAADAWDADERTPREVLHKLAHMGYLGAVVSPPYRDASMDMVTFGLLNEELGRGCSSLRSLLTVHSMVIQAVQRWGRREIKERWLPKLASGEAIGAFALSEPDVGSDASAIQARATATPEGYLLNGRKKWITSGQIADLFLVFARYEERPCAFLVERERAGLTILPLKGLLGLRASMPAELHFQQCLIPKSSLVGGEGFGVSAVAASALDLGRYSVACGCVGLAQACLDAVLSYTENRRQFGVELKEHQLVQQMVTNMLVTVQAARLLCYHAGALKDQGDPRMIMQTWSAKYFASRTAMRAASDAVQLHGANGCSNAYPVQRYFRDAKIMEIIEGSTQIQQVTIARYGYHSPR